MDHDENPGAVLAEMIRKNAERKKAAYEEKMKNAPPPQAEPSPQDDAPAERERPDKAKRPKPPKAAKPPHNGGRWVGIYEADANRILGDGDHMAPKALAVWHALIKKAEDVGENTFTMSDGYLKTTIPGMGSRDTVRKATKLLARIGMLESVSFADSGNFRTALRRTIHPAGPLINKQTKGVKKPEEDNPFV